MNKKIHGGVARKSEMEAASLVVQEWLMLDPAEVKLWRWRQKGLREAHEWTGGWSASGELLAAQEAPSYVVYGVKRRLERLGWSPEKAKNWDRELVGGKYQPSKLWNQVVRDLLPEAQVASKERVRRSYNGLDIREGGIS